MSAGAYERPTLRYIGNVRDLLRMIGNVGEDAWVVEFGVEGWRVRVAPMNRDGTGPYRMAVYNREGTEMMQRIGCITVCEAAEAAATFLAGYGYHDRKMLEIASALDAR